MNSVDRLIGSNPLRIGLPCWKKEFVKKEQEEGKKGKKSRNYKLSLEKERGGKKEKQEF